MADDTRLIAQIEANTKQFENALRRIERSTNQTFGQADRSVRRLETSLRSSSAQLISIGKTFATAFGAGFLVGGFAQIPRLISDVVRQAAGLVDLADKIGITTDALQELRFQAEQAGSSGDALDSMLEKFSKQVGLAATGTGELLKILTANGIALRDNEGRLRPLLDLLAAYAELIKNAANDQDRAVLSLEGFGRAGDEAAVVFRDGADGIKQFADEAHRANQVVGEEGLRTLEGYDDRLSKLSGRWNTFWTDATIVALTALEKIGQAEHFILDPIIEGIGNLGKTAVADAEAELTKIDSRIEGVKSALAEEVSFNMDTSLTEKKLNALINRANVLRGIIGAAAAEQAAGEAAARISVPGGAGGAASRFSAPVTIIPSRAPPGRTGGGGGGRDSAAEQVKREKEAVVDLIAELQRELTLVGASEVAQRTSNELRQAGAAATDEQKAQISALVQQIATEEEAQRRLIDTLDEIRDAAGGALSAFNDGLRDGQGLAGGLRSALDNVLDTVIRIAEQAAISSLLGGFGQAGGGILSGFFAGGGFLGAGKWGIAGERGPELIRGPAHVVPRGGGWGGAGRMNISISLAGATGDQAIAAAARAAAMQGAEMALKQSAGYLREQQAAYG